MYTLCIHILFYLLVDGLSVHINSNRNQGSLNCNKRNQIAIIKNISTTTAKIESHLGNLNKSFQWNTNSKQFYSFSFIFDIDIMWRCMMVSTVERKTSDTVENRREKLNERSWIHGKIPLNLHQTKIKQQNMR